MAESRALASLRTVASAMYMGISDLLLLRMPESTRLFRVLLVFDVFLGSLQPLGNFTLRPVSLWPTKQRASVQLYCAVLGYGQPVEGRLPE